MHAVLANVSILAVFNLGPGELGLILAVVAILIASRRFPDLWRGMHLGHFEFLKTLRDVLNEFDGQAFDAGKSLGGIHGKPAAEALTPGNHTAELYDPAVLRDRKKAGEIARKPIYKRFLRLGVLLFLLVGLVAAILWW